MPSRHGSWMLCILLAGCVGEGVLFRGRPAGHWIRRLEDRDSGYRAEAYLALEKIGADDDDVVPALVGRMGNEDEKESNLACDALKECGEKALPELAEALESPCFNARTGAAWVLGGLGPKGAPAVPALVAALEAEKRDGLGCYVRALGQIGPEARAVVPTLVSLLQDEDLFAEAARALADIGQRQDEAAGAIAARWPSADPERRRWLAEILASFRDHTGPAVLLLVKALADEDLSVRFAAVESLGKLGPAAREALPDLRRLAEALESEHGPSTGLLENVRQAIQEVEGKGE